MENFEIAIIIEMLVIILILVVWPILNKFIIKKISNNRKHFSIDDKRLEEIYKDMLKNADIEELESLIEKTIQHESNFRIKNDDKKFEEMYNNMLKNINIEELEFLRKKAIQYEKNITTDKTKFWPAFLIMMTLGLFTIGIAVIGNSMLGVILTYALVILAPLIYMNFIKKKNEIPSIDDITIYRDKYKEKIIPEFLKQFEEKIKYHPDEGIPREIYDMAKFEMYDTYESEDMMDIMLKNDCRAKMAEVLTTYISEGRKGRIYHNILFAGIFALIETPKKFKEELYVKQDEELTVRSITPKCEKIQLDSPEFEQYFDIYGTNKIVAMQLLTADIMQMFIDFRKDTGISFEFAIKNNRIFLRFEGGGLFEIPNLEKTLWDKDIMYRDYKILNFTFALTYKITKLIEETEY